MTTVALGLLGVMGLLLVAAWIQGVRAARSVRGEDLRAGEGPKPDPARRP